jgi:hypothetical protein
MDGPHDSCPAGETLVSENLLLLKFTERVEQLRGGRTSGGFGQNNPGLMSRIARGEKKAEALNRRGSGYLGRMNRCRGAVICDQTMGCVIEGFRGGAAVFVVARSRWEVLTVNRLSDEAEVGERQAGAHERPPRKCPLPLYGREFHDP